MLKETRVLIITIIGLILAFILANNIDFLINMSIHSLFDIFNGLLMFYVVMRLQND